MDSYQGKRFKAPGSGSGGAGSHFAAPAQPDRAGAPRAGAPGAHAVGTPGASAPQGVVPPTRVSTASERGAGRSPRDPRRGRARTIVSRVLIGLGILLLLAAAGIFVMAQIGYRQADEAYSELGQYVTINDTEGDDVPEVDWDALKQVSEDIVAWIYIPGTDISFPVVQGETNDQYLRALPDGTYNGNGSIMLDADQTAPGMVDQQTTVYGHHMNNGSMFDPIERSLDQETFDSITTVYYLTPDATYKLTPLFTARVPDTYVAARQANFGTAEDLQSYLTELHDYAQAQAPDMEERLAKTDKVLALVTCSGIAPADHRAVMICTIAEQR